MTTINGESAEAEPGLGGSVKAGGSVRSLGGAVAMALHRGATWPGVKTTVGGLCPSNVVVIEPSAFTVAGDGAQY